LELEGGKRKAEEQTVSLAQAAYSQYQAEECYRFYVNALKNCNLKDAKCIKAYRGLEGECAYFAKNAYDLLKKHEM